MRDCLSFFSSHTQDQYDYERAHLENGEQLMHSKYLQNLAILTLSLKLEDVVQSSEPPISRDLHGNLLFVTRESILQHIMFGLRCIAGGQWGWLKNLGLTIRAAEALMQREKLPQDFVERFKIGRPLRKQCTHQNISLFGLR